MYGQLVVKPICAKLTYDSEWFGKMDCYAKITIGGSVYKTDVAHDQGKTPNWQNTFNFMVSGEQMAQVMVYDKDDASADDYIGECQIPLQEVYTRRNVSNWYNLNRRSGSAGQIMISFEFYPQGGAGGMGMGGMGMQGGMGGMGMQGGMGMGGMGGMGGGYGQQGMGMGGGYGNNMGGMGGMGGGYGNNMGGMGGNMGGMGGMGGYGNQGGYGGGYGGY